MTIHETLRNMSDDTILIEAERVYLRCYRPWLGEYDNLNEYDEAILSEFKFRNNTPYEDTIYSYYSELTTHRDCKRFLQIRGTINSIINNLEPVEESTEKWYVHLNVKVSQLLSFLKKWAADTEDIANDCQSIAGNFEYGK